MIAAAALWIACCDEPHCRSIVIPGTCSGSPAARAALRPTLKDCSPTCDTPPHHVVDEGRIHTCVGEHRTDRVRGQIDRVDAAEDAAFGLADADRRATRGDDDRISAAHGPLSSSAFAGGSLGRCRERPGVTPPTDFARLRGLPHRVRAALRVVGEQLGRDRQQDRIQFGLVLGDDDRAGVEVRELDAGMRDRDERSLRARICSAAARLRSVSSSSGMSATVGISGSISARGRA
jgi:hypothetical protein